MSGSCWFLQPVSKLSLTSLSFSTSTTMLFLIQRFMWSWPTLALDPLSLLVESKKHGCLSPNLRFRRGFSRRTRDTREPFNRQFLLAFACNRTALPLALSPIGQLWLRWLTKSRRNPITGPSGKEGDHKMLLILSTAFPFASLFQSVCCDAARHCD